MYPPLSQVFSQEDQTLTPENINNSLPIETSLKEVGMNIKVVDIDIEDAGPKPTETKEIPTDLTPSEQLAAPTSKLETKVTGPTKTPLAKRSSTGSLVSARAARIKGLMDNDLRPKKDHTRPTEVNQEIENGPG